MRRIRLVSLILAKLSVPGHPTRAAVPEGPDPRAKRPERDLPHGRRGPPGRLRGQRDPELWSGYISGALTADGFLEAFERAGFYGIRVLERQEAPWRVVGGIEFRSVTKGEDYDVTIEADGEACAADGCC